MDRKSIRYGRLVVSLELATSMLSQAGGASDLIDPHDRQRLREIISELHDINQRVRSRI